MRSIIIILTIFVVACKPKGPETKNNWQEELLGFGQMWSDKDTVHKDFYYFGNLKMDSTKLACFRFGIPNLREDTLFLPNSLLYHSFKFCDSLRYKWKEGFLNKDTSAYLISKDSLGIIHLQKAFGIKWTPRRLYVRMNSGTFDTDVKYFINSSWSYDKRFSMLVDSLRGIRYFTSIRQNNEIYQREIDFFTHTDSIVFSSFLNDLIENRSKIHQWDVINCWAGCNLEILYEDSIYQFDENSFLKNLGFIEEYFLFKLNKFSDTADIDVNNFSYYPDKLFKNKAIAREIVIPPPPPELKIE